MTLRAFVLIVVAALAAAGCRPASILPSPEPAPAPSVRIDVQVREAQVRLRDLGYYRSGIDGIAGPGTRAAVLACQTDLGLSRTGVVDDALIRAMDRFLAANPPEIGEPTAADVFRAQRALKRIGYYDGRIDGRYDKDTLKAVVLYQRKNSLARTGKLTADLLTRMDRDAARL